MILSGICGEQAGDAALPNTSLGGCNYKKIEKKIFFSFQNKECVLLSTIQFSPRASNFSSPISLWWKGLLFIFYCDHCLDFFLDIVVCSSNYYHHWIRSSWFCNSIRTFFCSHKKMCASFGNFPFPLQTSITVFFTLPTPPPKNSLQGICGSDGGDEGKKDVSVVVWLECGLKIAVCVCVCV